MAESPFFLFGVAVVIVVLVMVSVMAKSRRSRNTVQSRVCDACGANQPDVAQFCRRCGKKLG